MGKHDIGTKHNGKLHGMELSKDWGYDIADVMGGMEFDDKGNPAWESPYAVTMEELQEMRKKLCVK